jgi:hypothetical protein
LKTTLLRMHGTPLGPHERFIGFLIESPPATRLRDQQLSEWRA